MKKHILHIRLLNCGLRDLNNIYFLSLALAQYFPKPEQSVSGIHELLLNAFEHGNLGVGFEEKTQLMCKGKFREEIARRLEAPENRCKEVHIKLTHDYHECRLVITDQGKGFSWKNFTEQRKPNVRPNGRGLWIAFNSGFDQVLFNAAGNQVTCIARPPADQRDTVLCPA